MKTDKNTVIGYIIIGLLFFGFFYFTNKQNASNLAIQAHKDSIAAALKASKIKPMNVADSLRLDSMTKMQTAGDFASAGIGSEQIITVDNDLMKVSFSSKGGQIKNAVLKNYNSYNVAGKQVTIGGDKDSNQLGYDVNTSANHAAKTTDLFFTPSPIVKNADGSQTLTFTLAAANGEKIVHQYIIRPNEYFIDWNIHIDGANQILSNHVLNFDWQTEMHQQQKSRAFEIQNSRIAFYNTDNDFDYKRASNNTTTETFDDPLKWMSFKQQFFNSTLLCKTGSFEKGGSASLLSQPDSSKELFEASANLKMNVANSNTIEIPMQLYYGPNDYNILKHYDNGMKNIVDLGSGMFSFVKYINRGIIFPIFNFFASFVTNYGWVIFLLTLVIRLLISPLTYSSYKSGAKMRVLRPELDALKAKNKDNQQQFAMEQMTLYREAGVNPMGGCLPALLQIPIFFSLYSFFSSNIALRGKSFLWAPDLSAYDSIIHWNTNLPVIGDHLSLFTVFSAITSLMIALYNRNNTPQMQEGQGQAMLKYMPYIMPIAFLFWWNSLPSALAWYYTVSNLVTLLIQVVIQKFIIKPEKLLAQINDNRKNPKKKKTSGFAAKLQQMQEMQAKMEEQKRNSGK